MTTHPLVFTDENTMKEPETFRRLLRQNANASTLRTPWDGGSKVFFPPRAARAIPYYAEFVQFRAAQSAALP